MRTQATFKPFFKATKSGEGSVSVEAYFKETRRRYYKKTNHKIKADEWDHESRKVIRRPDKDVINAQVAAFISEVYNEMMKKQYNGLDFTVSDFKNYGERDTSSFTSYMEESLESEKLRNKRLYEAMIKIFKEFVSSDKSPYSKQVGFHEVDSRLPDAFEGFMLNHYRKKGGGGKGERLSDTSRRTAHVVVSKYLGKAVRNGLIDRNPYKTAEFSKPKSNDRDVALTFDEVEALEGLKLEKKNERKVRDWFVFCCYTGLRIGDFKSLSAEHLVRTMKGWEIDRGKIQKTTASINLPLYDLFDGKPESILLDYWSVDQDGTVFNTLADDNLNKTIRRLAKKAGIKKHITWHVARHTFCTLLAELGLNAYQIMALAGHKTITVAQKYVNNPKKVAKAGLEGINWKNRARKVS